MEVPQERILKIILSVSLQFFSPGSQRHSGCLDSFEGISFSMNDGFPLLVMKRLELELTVSTSSRLIYSNCRRRKWPEMKMKRRGRRGKFLCVGESRQVGGEFGRASSTAALLTPDNKATNSSLSLLERLPQKGPVLLTTTSEMAVPPGILERTGSERSSGAGLAGTAPGWVVCTQRLHACTLVCVPKSLWSLKVETAAERSWARGDSQASWAAARGAGGHLLPLRPSPRGWELQSGLCVSCLRSYTQTLFRDKVTLVPYVILCVILSPL